MSRLVDLIKLERLDNLIRHAATGEPAELAERLGMSRSNLFEMISFLKEEMKAPIIYNRNRPSYVYGYTPKFYLGFEQERLNSVEMNNSSGGDAECSFEQEQLNPVEMTNTYGGGDEKAKKKIKVEIEIDDDACILDEDIDFNDLYH